MFCLRLKGLHRNSGRRPAGSNGRVQSAYLPRGTVVQRATFQE